MLKRKTPTIIVAASNIFFLFINKTGIPTDEV
jgi:hypothetical protein